MAKGNAWTPGLAYTGSSNSNGWMLLRGIRPFPEQMDTSGLTHFVRYLNPLAKSAPQIVLQVSAGLVAMFSLAGFLMSSYNAEKDSRAQHHFSEGKLLEAGANPAGAVEQYRTALSFSRDNTEYQLALARVLMEEGSLNEAERYLSDLVRMDSTNADALWMLARIASRRVRAEEAENFYQRAIYSYWPADRAADRLQARMELVELLSANGSTPALLAQLLLLKDELPDERDLQLRVAGLFLLASAPAEAVELYRHRVVADRSDGDSYAGLGEAELARGNYISAQTAFRNARRLQPENVQVQNRLELVGDVLALDPTLRGLSTFRRYERSRALLAGALAKVMVCLPYGPLHPDTGEQFVVEPAREILESEDRPQRTDETIERNLFLADQLWYLRQRICPGRPDEDALARVLTKIST